MNRMQSARRSLGMSFEFGTEIYRFATGEDVGLDYKGPADSSDSGVELFGVDELAVLAVLNVPNVVTVPTEPIIPDTPGIKRLREMFTIDGQLTYQVQVNRMISWAKTIPTCELYEEMSTEDGVESMHLRFRYKLFEVKKEVGTDVVTTYERGFKHMQPMSPVVIQTTHGNVHAYKIWEFRRKKVVKAVKAVKTVKTEPKQKKANPTDYMGEEKIPHKKRVRKRVERDGDYVEAYEAAKFMSDEKKTRVFMETPEFPELVQTVQTMQTIQIQSPNIHFGLTLSHSSLLQEWSMRAIFSSPSTTNLSNLSNFEEPDLGEF